jgi:hypothetical protein
MQADRRQRLADCLGAGHQFMWNWGNEQKTAAETKILIDITPPRAYILCRSEHKVLAIKFFTNRNFWRELTTLNFIS